MYVDVHCHLSFPEFDEDREAVIRQMISDDISLLVDPGIDLETSRKSIALAAAHPNLFPKLFSMNSPNLPPLRKWSR